MEARSRPRDLKVLGFGDNVVDVYEHRKRMYPGGNCVNFAVFAKAHQVECAAYMGYFGDDPAGRYVEDVLQRLGIDLRCSRRLAGENGFARVTVRERDRIFLESNHGGIRGKVPYRLGEEELAYISGFDLVHSGNYSFTEAMLPRIQALGVPISFDFSDDSKPEYYRRVAPYITYAFCSKSGGEDEVMDHLRWMKSLGPELVMASRGEKGSILYDGEHFYRQESEPLTEVVDTMGAGDSLITSFLVHYLDQRKQGRDTDGAIRESLRRASEFAAATCGTEGSFGYGIEYRRNFFESKYDVI